MLQLIEDWFRGEEMKAVEAKGDLLADGTIRLREKVDVPAGEVRILILVPEESDRIASVPLSDEESQRLMAGIEYVAGLSRQDGPAVSNRDHDSYLYGSIL